MSKATALALAAALGTGLLALALSGAGWHGSAQGEAQGIDFEKTGVALLWGEDWDPKPNTCDDGKDNGGDGPVDLNDADCLLPRGQVPVSERAHFVVVEALRHDAGGAEWAEVVTKCTAPTTNPPSHCSYKVKSTQGVDETKQKVGVNGDAPKLANENDLFEGNTIEVVRAVNVPAGQGPLLWGYWDLHCGQAGGPYKWQFSNSVASLLGVPDPKAGNNAKSWDVEAACFGFGGTTELLVAGQHSAAPSADDSGTSAPYAALAGSAAAAAVVTLAAGAWYARRRWLR